MREQISDDDDLLLLCGTDQDHPCQLYSSLNLTAVSPRRRLEHDQGLQSIVGDSLDSVVVTSPSRDT